MMALYLNETILRLFAQKRNFSSKQALLDDINKRLANFQPQLEMPFTIGGFTFDAKYHAAMGDIAVSVVLKHNRQEGKGEVAYILSQMETAEKMGLIKGGIVVYNTDNLKEWENNCIALERPSTYNDQQVNLDAYYCEHWNTPKEHKKTSRRYALFLTEGTRQLCN